MPLIHFWMASYTSSLSGFEAISSSRPGKLLWAQRNEAAVLSDCPLMCLR